MAEISQITLPSGSTYDIKDVTARDMPSAYYGTCSTAAATAAKVVEVANEQGFTLKAGALIGIKFTNTNTASNVTLNVNNTGAKNIWYNDSAYTGNSNLLTGYANRLLFYMYDGTNWCIVNKGWIDNNTTYTAASAAPLMDGTAAVGTSAKYAREDHVHPSDTTKVDKETGKGLSTNDYTTTEKNKLAGIAAGAEVNVQSDWNVTDTASDAFIKNKPTIPTKTGDLTNNSNFVSDASYVHTDSNFTTTLKNKLNGIAAGAQVNVQSDWNVTDTASDAFIKNKPTIPTDTWKAFYGTCSTAAATAEKAITVSSDQNFTLRVGVVIGVKSTYTSTASNVTLNVNNTGAKKIWYNTSEYTGRSGDVTGYANRITYYMYDGTYWVWISHGVDNNSTYTAASATPLMDGTAAVGTSTKYAREDHVHPTDTSRVPTSRTINGKALSSNITLSASDVGALDSSSSLDATKLTGTVPTASLPSYVDDVLEYSKKSSFPATGQTGKIYVDKATNLTYRWSGSAYVQISPSLALGTTSSTAYRGDYGNTAYTHATDSSRLTTATSSGLYKVAATAQGHIASLTAVTKADITALGIPGQVPEGAQASSTTPKMDGTATVGTQITFARGDHVHPTDTSRAAANHTHSAYVNQNAFSNVKVGSTTIAADTTTDTIQLAAGSNITLTPDATNDKVTIAATDTKYTAATAAPGNVASSSSAGTSTNYARQDHTHGITLATGDSNGQVKIAGSNVSVKGWNTAATYDVETTVANDAKLPTGAAVKSFVEGKGYVTTDTKNTTGSTDTSSKIFLIGATSQATNPQTYSDNEIYATSGVLTTKSVQVGGTAATMQYNSATDAIDFIFD